MTLPASPNLTNSSPPMGQAHGPWQVAERLTRSDIEHMITSYLAGSTIASLAERHAISASSVKRLLWEHGTRKHRQRPAA